MKKIVWKCRILQENSIKAENPISRMRIGNSTNASVFLGMVTNDLRHNQLALGFPNNTHLILPFSLSCFCSYNNICNSDQRLLGLRTIILH